MVLFILSETTLPSRAPRGNLRGGVCTKSQPGIVELSANSSLEREEIRSCDEAVKVTSCVFIDEKDRSPGLLPFVTGDASGKNDDTAAKGDF